jgi:hypothetical protein
MTKTDYAVTVKELLSERRDLYDTLGCAVAEAERVNKENKNLTVRNALLESEMTRFLEIETELVKTKNLLECATKREQWALTKLKEEQEVIKKWNESKKKLDDQLDSQVMKQVSCLGYDHQEKQSLSSDKEIEKEAKVGKTSLKFIKFVRATQTLDQGKTNSESEASTSRGNKKQPMTLKSFKKGKTKIDCASVDTQSSGDENVSKVDDSLKNGINQGDKKKNRNGKLGVSKFNHYTPNSEAPRKVCWNCGKASHLSFQCKDKPQAFTGTILYESQLPKSTLELACCNKKEKGKVHYPKVLGEVTLKKKMRDLTRPKEKVDLKLSISRLATKITGPNLSWVPKV